MAACNQTKTCLFYNKYKNDEIAVQAFIANACDKNMPCARKIWTQKTGAQPGPDVSPSGTLIRRFDERL